MRARFRPDTGVLCRILLAFAESAATKKTHLHLASRVRWDSFLRYLFWLRDQGYVETSNDDSDTNYRLTPSGYAMQADLQKFLAHFHVFGEVERERSELVDTIRREELTVTRDLIT